MSGKRRAIFSVAKFVAPDLVSGLYLAAVLVWLFAGTVSAVSLSNAGVDHAVHDTYYVVAHWHYIFTALSVIAALWFGYRAFEAILGIAYSRTLGVLQFVCFFAGITVIYLPQFFLSSGGMPRRYVDYQDQFTLWNRISGFGYIIVCLSQLLAIGVVIEALRRKHRLKKQN